MATNSNKLVYQIQILGVDTANLSVAQLVENQKKLKQTLAEIPAAGSKAYENLKKQVESANNGTATLEEELEKLRLQYKANQKTIEDFNKTLEGNSKAEERAARAAELALQRRVAAEQAKSEKVLQSLRDTAEKQRQIELSASQEGLEILRQEEIERLRAMREFAELSEKEQEANIAKINARYDKETQKLGEKLAKENPVAGSTNALRKELIALNKELDNTAHEIDGQVNPRFVELTQRSRALTHEISEAEQASGRFQRNVGNYPDLGASIKESFQNIGPDLIAAFSIGSVVELTIEGLKSVIAVGAEFEQSLSNLSAITGATGKDLDFYSEKAQELGISSTLGASQAAEAFKIIGGASPDLLKSKEALVGVTESAITLGQAATLELPDAAASLTTVLNQFKNGAETAEQTVARAAKTIDVLAAGSQAGAAEVGDIAESMKKFGTTANSLGISLQTSVGLIETLGEKSIKSEIAGTGLRGTLVKLASAGIGMKDGVLDINAALEELAPIQNDVTQLTKLFGQENLVVAQTLIQNRDKVISFTEAVDKSGVAAQQARINMDNLAGDQAKFNAAVEGLQLSVFAQLKGDTRELVQTFTSIVNFITVGLKDGLDDLLAPVKSFYGAIVDVFKVFGQLFSIFGKTRKEGNALGDIFKVIGAISQVMSIPLRALVAVLKFMVDGFIGAVEGVKKFIASVPFLNTAVDGIIKTFTFLKDVVGEVAGFIGSIFGEAEKATSNAELLIRNFGSLEKAASALRKEFGATKQEFDEFIKGFDQKLLDGKSFAEAQTIVEQAFKEFLDGARKNQQEAADEALLALNAQAQAEEDALLEKSAKGLEILRKRQKAELQSQEGFSELSKARQLLLLEKIDKEINAKKRALTKVAEKEDFTEALRALRERIEKEKEALIVGTEEGQEIIRQARLKQLEAEKGFSKLTLEEQSALIDGVNREIDAKIQAIRDKRSDETQKSIEDSVAVTIGFINSGLEQLQTLASAANLEARKAIDQQEQDALAKAGNNLELRLRIQDDFNLKRKNLEQDYQDELLTLQLHAIEDQLKVADISADALLDLERQKQELLAQIYEADKEKQADVEETKREQLQKTREAYQQIASGIQSAVGSITSIFADSAENQIRSLSELNERQQEQADNEIGRIDKEYELRRRQLEGSITDQNQLAQALDVLEAKKNANTAAVEARAEREQAAADRAIEQEQQRKQKALAFQKRIDASIALSNQIVTISNNIKAISGAAAVPFPGNLIAIVTTIASIAAAIAQVRTLTQATNKFEQGGQVNRDGTPNRKQGRGGMHRGPSHKRGGINIEVQGGEYETNVEGTQMFLPYLNWMNEQGLRKQRGLPHATSVEDMLADIDRRLPMPMPTPSFRFQTGGLTSAVVSPRESSNAIEEGLSQGFNEMNGLLRQIAKGQGDSQVVLSLPELNREQAKLSRQEQKAKL